MNFEAIVAKVGRELTDFPLDADRIAARAMVSREDCYRALVRLYDIGLASITRKPGEWRPCGWVSTETESEAA